MSKTLTGFVVMIGLLAAGCGAQPGQSLVKWDGTGSRVTDAPQNARYALYSSFGGNPDVSYSLKKGDSIGFITEGGHVYAIAGSHKDEIKSGKIYYWKMQKE